MLFLRVFRHLLPNARAWRAVIDKQLRQFLAGLAGSATDARTFIDRVWGDMFPETTRELKAWEDQFALPSSGLGEQQRRDRLAAAWRAAGGQDPRYIQETLQARGFDVYVHDWWVPGTEPAVGVHGSATARDPAEYVRRDGGTGSPLMQCGGPLAQCGEPFAQAGNGTIGFPLVNKILETVKDITALCGEPDAEAGEPELECGGFLGYTDVVRRPVVPYDPELWTYFFYIGGKNYGDSAEVDAARRDEFEALCLQICPTQLWLGIIVRYV